MTPKTRMRRRINILGHKRQISFFLIHLEAESKQQNSQKMALFQNRKTDEQVALKKKRSNMETNEIGCCGACCKTCIEQQKIKYPKCKALSGLQVRYESGERALDKAKFEIQVCCSRDGSLETYADCSDYPCLS